jgi:hypothetical protein
MAANWIGFISELSQFLSSKSSSGPSETGEKFAQFYLNAIRTAQTYNGNFLQSPASSGILAPAFSAVFEDLSKSTSPTAEEKSKDPKYSPPKEESVNIDPDKQEEDFLNAFNDYLRKEAQLKFLYSEKKSPFSPYVLETDKAVVEQLIKDDKTGIKRIFYENEKKAYDDLKKEYSESLVGEEINDPDPYDKIAQTIILFWLTSGPIVFSGLIPVPPTTEPIPGTYAIVYPGSVSSLAEGIRRAFNAGLDKKYEKDFTGTLSALAISNALAVAFSKHLASLKFIYFGSISGTPTPGFVSFIY